MSKPKPSIPATTKALQAWQSELRRLEKRLEEWTNQLAERERVLEEQEAEFQSVIDGADEDELHRYAERMAEKGIAAEDEEDCGCTPEDAAANCDCPKCKDTRKEWVMEGESLSEPISSATPTFSKKPASNKQPVGDEVVWLENLWKLEDGRKKRK